MSTPVLDDDYPYDPHTKAAREAEEFVRHNDSTIFWRWIKRLGLTVAALATAILIAISVVAVRGFSQARAIG